MSYCRFGSDNGKSDVYVWHDVAGGWCTVVAECRIIGVKKRPRNALDAYKTRKIGGPHDGAHFRDRTRKATVKRLMWLRGAGYHVPENAIKRLRAEMGKGDVG